MAMFEFIRTLGTPGLLGPELRSRAFVQYRIRAARALSLSKTIIHYS
jgi:hypothetical protein